MHEDRKDDRLRIALVSDFFCPNTGGVETHIYYLGECLRRLGHSVIVLTHAYGQRRGIYYLSNGLKVYYLPIIVVQSCSLTSVLGTLYWFRRILLDERIQIVHGHSSFSAMGHEALYHGWCLGMRTVFTEHSLLGFADASSILMNNLILKYSLTNVDRIICVSHTSKENTILRARLRPARVFVIPNAINTRLFQPDFYQFHANLTTIIVVCRLVYRKGVDLLVDVIPEVCRRHPRVSPSDYYDYQVHFIVGGDGPKRVELEEMRERYKLHSRVRMFGALPHNKVRDVLVQGQIFLNTSLTEAFGMSLVEAACSGLHVVSTRVGGIPEVLPEEFVTLCEPNVEGPYSELSAALSDAIHRREHNRLMDPAARHAAVREMYNWTNVAERTETVYRAALADEEISLWWRLRNYTSVGLWFGLVWAWMSLVNVLLISFLNAFDGGVNTQKTVPSRLNHLKRPLSELKHSERNGQQWNACSYVGDDMKIARLASADE